MIYLLEARLPKPEDNISTLSCVCLQQSSHKRSYLGRKVQKPGEEGTEKWREKKKK